MKISVLIALAWKNIWAHRMRASLTIVGVAIGIGAITFLVSLGYGLEQLVTNQVADFKAFTVVDIPSTNLKGGKITSESINSVKTLAHVTNVDEIADLAGSIRMDSQKSTAEAVMEAVNTSNFTISPIKLKAGKIFESASTNQIIVNQTLADLLGYSGSQNEIIGKNVIINLRISPDLRPSDGIDGSVVKENLPFTVVGLSQDTSNANLYMPLASAVSQGVSNRSSLKVQIDSRNNVDLARREIEALGFNTDYVGDTVNEISQVFGLFRVILGGFGLIALIVASLATFNMLTISLLERIREVGLLKMLGMKRRDIFRLFIVESISIGIIGGLCGLALGTAFGTGLNGLLAYFAHRANADIVVLYISPPSFILVVIAISLCTGLLTGLYPAIRAIKTNPLDVLRYE